MAREIDRNMIARLLTIAAHVGAVIPLASLLWDYWFYQFGADPIREITLRTGRSALTLLLLSLACTPLHIIFGWGQLIRLRKPLGLYAFFYAVLHGLTFIWLDYALQPGLIAEAIFQKPYALAGFATFVLLVPLALTSNRWSMRKLGRTWKRLHKLVYVIAALALLHFFWLVKGAYTRPFMYAGILGVLLLMRVKPIKRKITGWRGRLKGKLATDG
jgi:sulfoxide reductase heme-binding subunit YedZ